MWLHVSLFFLRFSVAHVGYSWKYFPKCEKCSRSTAHRFVTEVGIITCAFYLSIRSNNWICSYCRPLITSTLAKVEQRIRSVDKIPTPKSSRSLYHLLAD